MGNSKKSIENRETIWETETRLKQEAKDLLIILKQRENDKARNI
tara:strand:+ start:3032 stop:3163 length:132 start_codon:yes stop_codon:yes gene_type:complete